MQARFSQVLFGAKAYLAMPYSIIHCQIVSFIAATGVLDQFLPPETSGKLVLSVTILFFTFALYKRIESLSAQRDSSRLALYKFHRSVLVGEIEFALSLEQPWRL